MISKLTRTFIKTVAPLKLAQTRYPWMLNQKLYRTFATATEDIKSVPGNKPPANEESPQGRYASVLFSAASSKEALHLVLEDVRNLKELFNQSDIFRNFIYNTAFKRSEQTTVLQTLIESMGFHQITVDFLSTLIENKRLDSLPKILDKYIEYYRILNKEENITIISAFELAEEDKGRITQALKQSQKGVNFTLKYKIDPTILGGLQMYSGNKFMDCSLVSRVAKVKTELSKLTV